MNAPEFLTQFDVLYNNITSNQAPGLNEYEKSVFLTKAQDEVIKNHFNPKSNARSEGFDDSYKRQVDFSNIIETYSQVVPHYNTSVPNTKFDYRSSTITLPEDLFIMVNEQVLKQLPAQDTVDEVRQVIPISYMEYTRLMQKPYKEPLKNQVWRLISEGSTNAITTELVFNSKDRKEFFGNDTAAYHGVHYIIRYVRKPKPIILADFSTFGEDVTIQGKGQNSEDYNKDNPCELNPILHEEILQRAVELAKVAWAGNAESTITTGQRSE